MMKWCVFYADGTVRGSKDVRPENALGLGVVTIAQEHEDPQEKPYLQHMTDYYVWLGNRWLGCDLFRLWQYIFVEQYAFPKAALAGQTVSNEEFMKINKRAKVLKDEWYGSSNV